jgi:hypothetical protein
MDLRLVREAELMNESPQQSSVNASPEPKSSGAATIAAQSGAAAGKTSAPARFSKSPSPTPSSAPREEKSKRAAGGAPPSAAGQKTARVAKKKRTEAGSSASTSETLISPTLLTWVVSAGVVVLVSVVGFGAGYVIGREVGRQEGAAGFISSTGGAPPGPSSVNATGSCSRDIISQSASGGGTLRRFRWGSMGRSVVA